MLLPVYILATGGCLPLSGESASYDSLPKFKNTAYSNRSQCKSAVGTFQKAGYVKKEPAFRLVLSLSVGITYLPGQAKDCPAGITVRWTVIGRKNLLLLQEASYVGIPYPPG